MKCIYSSVDSQKYHELTIHADTEKLVKHSLKFSLKQKLIRNNCTSEHELSTNYL